jgi:hypothetical protein
LAVRRILTYCCRITIVVWSGGWGYRMQGENRNHMSQHNTTQCKQATTWFSMY